MSMVVDPNLAGGAGTEDYTHAAGSARGNPLFSSSGEGHYPADDGSEAYALIKAAMRQKRRDNNSVAVAICDSAVGEARRSGLPHLASWALSVKSLTMATLGFKTDALALGVEALKVARDCCDRAMEARAMFAIGYAAMRSKDDRHAQKMFERSLECAREADSVHDIFWALNNLTYLRGERAMKMIQVDGIKPSDEDIEALFLFARNALLYARRTKVWSHRCYALLNLATAEFANANFRKAHVIVARYTHLARLNEMPRLIAYANLYEARLLTAQGKYAEAIEKIDTPEHFNDLAKADDVKLFTHEALATIHKKQGTFEQALHHFETARILDRRILAFESERQIQMLNAQLEVEEARANAQRLQLEAEALAVRNQSLVEDSEELKISAMRDALTGVGNRRAANIALADQIETAQAGGEGFCVCYLDIDYFKQVNDHYGHKIGDQILKTVSRILDANVRERDELFRFGGEEFVILIKGDREIDEIEICDRLRRSIADYDWIGIGMKKAVTASFGVARWRREKNAELVVARADKALYSAKDAGRNCVRLN